MNPARDNKPMIYKNMLNIPNKKSLVVGAVDLRPPMTVCL